MHGLLKEEVPLNSTLSSRMFSNICENKPEIVIDKGLDIYGFKRLRLKIQS